MESIVFGITIIVVVFLFLLQMNKKDLMNTQLIVKQFEVNMEISNSYLAHINKLEDRIQTGDAKQAAILNKEHPEEVKEAKKTKVDIGTATGLEVAKE